MVRTYSEEQLHEFFGGELGYLSAITYKGRPLELEEYQRFFLQNTAKLRWINKARQVGFSYIMSLEALTRCQLRRNYNATIVSFNLTEAKEKIQIAREAYESLPRGMRRKLVIDAKNELGFESAGGGGLSRISVTPSKSTRGRHGDVYLDELAFYRNDRAAYEHSLPLIVSDEAFQLTGCSTPTGEAGIFWEIAEQKHLPYPEHHRQVVPWWLSTLLCKDVRAAARAAAPHAFPKLSTKEMVERFGKPNLVLQSKSMAPEIFEQEFCCRFVSNTEAFLPYLLIMSCCDDDLETVDDPLELPRPRGRYVAGYDVARTTDASYLAVFDEYEGGYDARLLLRIKDAPFREQEDRLQQLLECVPIHRLSIDSMGIGMQLAENLHRLFPHIVVCERPGVESKARWATNVKILLQDKKLALPLERDLVVDFQSIRKKVSQAGVVLYDAPRTTEGHADGFWAVAMAVQRQVEPAYRGGTVRMRIIGDGGVIYDSNEENPQPPRSNPEPGSYEYNVRMFPDGVYTDDNPPPPPPTFKPVSAAVAAAGPIQYGRSKRPD